MFLKGTDFSNCMLIRIKNTMYITHYAHKLGIFVFNTYAYVAVIN